MFNLHLPKRLSVQLAAIALAGVFLTSVGCVPSQKQLKEAYDRGFAEGDQAGYQRGKSEGYARGTVAFVSGSIFPSLGFVVIGAVVGIVGFAAFKVAVVPTWAVIKRKIDEIDAADQERIAREQAIASLKNFYARHQVQARLDTQAIAARLEKAATAAMARAGIELSIQAALAPVIAAVFKAKMESKRQLYNSKRKALNLVITHPDLATADKSVLYDQFAAWCNANCISQEPWYDQLDHVSKPVVEGNAKSLITQS